MLKELKILKTPSFGISITKKKLEAKQRNHSLTRDYKKITKKIGMAHSKKSCVTKFKGNFD